MNVHFNNGLRYLFRSPGTKLAILALIILGVTGVSAVFNHFYSLTIKKLPFPQQDRLVVINENLPISDPWSTKFIKDESLDTLFSKLTACLSDVTVDIVIPEMKKFVQAAGSQVSDTFFEALGVYPMYGQDFKQHSDALAIIVSNRFWRNQLNRSADVIGKTMEINGGQYTVVGIMADTFDFPAGTDVWIYRPTGSLGGADKQLYGRLNQGISIEHATQVLNSKKFEEPKLGPRKTGNDGPVLQPMQTVYYSKSRSLILMLSTTSILFLILVCSGVMSILVTQGMSRKSEMTMRMILGASRSNLTFQLLIELLPLVIIGTIAGLWLSGIVGAWLKVQFPVLQGGDVAFPVQMIFFAIIIMIVTIISGLIPALHTSNVNLGTSLKSGTVVKRKIFSMQELLAGIQLGLALALLTGVGLLLQSMMFNVEFPMAWNSKEIAVVNVRFSMEHSQNSDDAITRRVNFYREFQHQLESMPEVVAAGVLNPMPFTKEAVRDSRRLATISKYFPEARRDAPDPVRIPALQGSASPEGFDISGVSLIAGRPFTAMDVEHETPFRRKFLITRAGRNAGGVVIINKYLAGKFWPRESAIGKTIYDGMAVSHEIVGVVQDFYQVADNDKRYIPAIYSPTDFTAAKQTFSVRLRSSSLVGAFHQRLFELDTAPAYIEVQTLENAVSESTANMRVALQLLGMFSLLGIVIAGLGVYATSSLMMVSRNREIGIRKALGAQSGDILKFALWRGIRTILIGVPGGLLFAWILSKTLSSFLFSFNANESVIWLISCVLLIGIATLATLIPALRAIRVNPVDAMRNE